MGKFTYNAQTSKNFDDRVLAHLQITIGTKLRRGEGFFFTWKDDISVGEGRSSVWMHAGASLIFKFHGSRQPDINLHWLEALISTANSAQGLHLVGEPAAALPVRQQSVLVG
ncbi:ATP-dependent DNA ligase [Microbacterium sp. zg.B48]|uniref:DUF7882 family protein n=1 Tax=unclassified Microbacterium TaxID=2609290 RepID=UPI00214BCD7F|nr:MULTISPECIES: ATP-dependent DNA ligase [unclassified Microbacterium]MCR2763363.1 ATP-dependent DNA ligase [Microbacterium sp. zg.B48]MCR2809084.1 ATP-dependent DNA ligase [Microbacterium sp. zg.B185]WIM20239.1 ATP-dependent DNA ligase [Microbacterium sp. zg-B185]